MHASVCAHATNAQATQQARFLHLQTACQAAVDRTASLSDAAKAVSAANQAAETDCNNLRRIRDTKRAEAAALRESFPGLEQSLRASQQAELAAKKKAEDAAEGLAAQRELKEKELAAVEAKKDMLEQV